MHWLHKTVDYLLLKKAYPERFVLVNFNNAINQTEHTARRICAALGVPFSESMLTATSLGRPTKGNSSFPKGEDVRGTFYALETQHKVLAEERWPPQFPALWRMVDEVAV